MEPVYCGHKAASLPWPGDIASYLCQQLTRYHSDLVSHGQTLPSLPLLHNAQRKQRIRAGHARLQMTAQQALLCIAAINTVQILMQQLLFSNTHPCNLLGTTRSHTMHATCGVVSHMAAHWTEEKTAMASTHLNFSNVAC